MNPGQNESHPASSSPFRRTLPVSNASESDLLSQKIDADGNPDMVPLAIQEPVNDEKKPDVLMLNSTQPIDAAAPENPKLEIKKTGTFDTIMNLTNALIGAGIISVPSTFTYCGLGPTFLLIIICCVLCHISGVIMLGLQKDLKIGGLDELAMVVLKKPGQYTTSVLVILFSLSCTVSYLIIGATQLKSWATLIGLKVESTGAWVLLVLIYWVIIPGPLTIPRSVAFLSKFSLFGIICVSFFAIVIAVKGIIAISKPSFDPTAVTGISIDFGIFTAFGVHALTFSLPVIFLPIIAPYDPSVKKRTFALGMTFIVSFFIITIPGVLGYMEFGSNTKSDILESFSDNDVVIIIVKVAIFCNVSISYPKILISIVGSLGQMFFKQNIPELLPSKQRYPLVAAINAVNLVIAMFLTDIKPILGIGGSLGGCAICFILPPLCRLVTTKDKLYTPTNILHIIFIIFGLLSTGFCTYSSVKDAISSYSK